MCVAITLMPGASLTVEEVYKMGMCNGDGVGVAWVKDGKVRMYKTCRYTPDYIARMIDHHKASPRLVHFRLATVGGTRPDLCHPFLIDAKGTCDPTAFGEKAMIHNGHFHRWHEVKELLDKEGLLPDKGPWSDSRLCAWLANEDLEWLEVLGGRVATLDKDGQFTHLGTWDDLREGVKVSNKSWNYENGYKKGGYTGARTWPGWNWGEEDWDAYVKAQKEKKEAQKEAIKKLLEEGKNDGQGKEEDEDQGQGTGETGTYEKTRPVSGGDAGTTGVTEYPGVPTHAEQGGRVVRLPSGGTPTPGTHLRGSRLSGGAGAVVGPGSAGRNVRYDQKPFRNPETGKVYQSTPAGTLVEITATLSTAERNAIGVWWGDPDRDIEDYGGEG